MVTIEMNGGGQVIGFLIRTAVTTWPLATLGYPQWSSVAGPAAVSTGTAPGRVH